MIEEILNRLNQGKKFSFHQCGLCNYPCGYMMSGTQLIYDSGCDCVNYTGYADSTKEDIENILHINPNTNFLEEKYWL